MIALGSDHGGFELKQTIKEWLDEQKIAYTDMGSFTMESVDYPEIAESVAQAVQSGEYEKGILICGTGLGMSIAANKFKGIRASCCSDCFSAKLTRQHNDANILCLGGRVVGPGLAIMMVDLFLHTEFEGGRHQKRLDMISEIEKN